MGNMDNMIFDESILPPEQQETMKIIETELISVLKEKNHSDVIRFWEPEERIPDEEILKKYSRIYSVELTSEYDKKCRKTIFKRTIIAKNWKYNDNHLVNTTYMGLPYEIQKKLIVWSKDSHKFLEKVVKEKLGYHIRMIRFDFLLQEDQTFIIPYLPLCSFYLTKNEKDKKEILMPVYLEEITTLFNRLRQMHASFSNNPPS